MLSLSQIYDSPRKLLVEANKILAATLDSRSFITMAYAVIDMNDRQMTWVWLFWNRENRPFSQ